MIATVFLSDSGIVNGIWLGKQRLGQKEKAEQDIKVEGGINITFKPANEGSNGWIY